MNSRKKYEDLVEQGKAKPLHEISSNFVGDSIIINEESSEIKFRSFRDIYDEFVEEHNDPDNITLFVDYLESIFNQ